MEPLLPPNYQFRGMRSPKSSKIRDRFEIFHTKRGLTKKGGFRKHGRMSELFNIYSKKLTHSRQRSLIFPFLYDLPFFDIVSFLGLADPLVNYNLETCYFNTFRSLWWTRIAISEKNTLLTKILYIITLDLTVPHKGYLSQVNNLTMSSDFHCSFYFIFLWQISTTWPSALSTQLLLRTIMNIIRYSYTLTDSHT